MFLSVISIKKLRKDMRISRNTIGEETGYSGSTIKRLEDGDPVRNFKTMKASCKMALENRQLKSENQLKQLQLEEANRILNDLFSEPPEICEEAIYEDSSLVTIKLPERGYFDGKL